MLASLQGAIVPGIYIIKIQSLKNLKLWFALNIFRSNIAFVCVTIFVVRYIVCIYFIITSRLQILSLIMLDEVYVF